MRNISSSGELKNAIQLLEIEQSFKGQELKYQFNIVYDSLRPVNLIKSTLEDIATSKGLADTLIGTATGYLTKKIVVGGSGNMIRKLMGSVLQFGVSKLVSRHPEAIRSVGQFIFQQIFSKTKRNV